MGLPEKDYFSIAETAAHWGTSPENLQYYAKQGKLELLIWVEDSVVQLYSLIENNGRLVKKRTGTESYSGYAAVEPQQLRQIFFSENPVVFDGFKSLHSAYFFYIFDQRKWPAATVQKLRISRQERERFEREYNIECSCCLAAKRKITIDNASFAGRPSVMHHVISHFKIRSETKAAFPTLAQEAAYLAKWAEENIDAQPPKSKTIKNVLRDYHREYRDSLPIPAQASHI